MRATDVIKKGKWVGFAIDTVVLDYDGRRRRRLALEGVDGFTFLLDLAEAPTLMPGDALKLEDGRLIRVEAAPEDLLTITCDNATQLNRIAYHLGNRHLPVEVGDGYLRIRADHVIEHMVKDLGATVEPLEAPFYPEGGAYGEHAGGHHHHGGHDHGHSHEHGDIPGHHHHA